MGVMKPVLQQYFKRLDHCVDKVRRLSRPLQDELGLAGFAYVRVYHDGRAGWLTSDADHDRLLVDSGFLEEDPLIDTTQALKEGRYLWFHDRDFEGCKEFYETRTKAFGIDHGMVLVNHQEQYLETGCFSGSLNKRALYNLFANETGIFRSFLEYFKEQLDNELLNVLDKGVELEDLKPRSAKARQPFDRLGPKERHRLLSTQGMEKFLRLSKREKESLSHFRTGLTYAEIGEKMRISSRTVEHLLESVKDKLDLWTRAELRTAAQKLHELGILPIQ